MDNELEQAGKQITEQLSNNSPNALRLSKQLLRDIQPIDEKLIAETINIIADARVSEQGQEGLKAFFEKRKPNWK